MQALIILKKVSALTLAGIFAAGCGWEPVPQPNLTHVENTMPAPTGGGARWLAGDHHIHSRFSVGWDDSTNPPSPKMGGDAAYPVAMNAAMGRRFGLEWMVSTDHGGPNHAKINLEHAFPDLLESRVAVPEVVQHVGMEFDTLGADHSSLIIPLHEREALDLYEIERRFSKREPWPADPTWDSQSRMTAALKFMQTLDKPPLVIAHHPSRSARGFGKYGMTEPSELRAWNDTAPDIAVGMEGAPGHQAIAQMMDRFGESKYGQYIGDKRPRGFYGGFLGGFPTMGGFDQMTAKLGGFWDSMLGEGRRWWITANSDSHVHWKDGGVDFWPGEYSKTYVLAQKTGAAIFDAIRAGKIFVVTGDLIDELWFLVESETNVAGLGDTLNVLAGSDVRVTVRVRDPQSMNFNNDNPTLQRIDIIKGDVSAETVPFDTNENPSTKVVLRAERSDLALSGDYLSLTYTVENVESPFYLRLRGTNTRELEPTEDPDREDPWSDLWFYSNPIFVSVVKS